MKEVKDLLIVGAGPAGLAAAVQAARDGISLTLVSAGAPGGLLRAARSIKNLPGFPAGVSGAGLAELMASHARGFGVTQVHAWVESLRRVDGAYEWRTACGMAGAARAVILATGTSPSGFDLPVPAGAGANVHRDPTTMPSDLIGMSVIVIGGGEAALDGALTVTDRGGMATVLVRGAAVKATKRLGCEAMDAGVKVVCGADVRGLSMARSGGLEVEFVLCGEGRTLGADHLLVATGRTPCDGLWRGVAGGLGLPGDVRSGVAGVFTAGDLIRGGDRFAATAVGDGQRAARLALEYLKMPVPEVISTRGAPDVASVFVARMRPGDDTSMVEFVDGLDTALPREEKWIANLSTQYGCPVGCVFCDSGHRYYGNLTAGEMLGQLAYIMGRHPGVAARCGKFKVHFARMGEPALNDAVLETIGRLRGFTAAPNVWACVATVAPAGREEWFRRLFDAKEDGFRGRFQLQFSMNTTDEGERAAMMPVSLMPFEWISGYIRRFHRDGDRKAVLNFALASGSQFSAARIMSLFSPETSAVKVTPLNPTAAGVRSGMDTVLR
ncbi:MAG: FAD-dependent oxidoreductase, partial [Myxococcota bacterium]